MPIAILVWQGWKKAFLLYLLLKIIVLVTLSLFTKGHWNGAIIEIRKKIKTKLLLL